MFNDLQLPGHRLPTLVQYCQRVASAHVECTCCSESKLFFTSVEIEPYDIAISSLGDNLRFELIKPVLTGCSPETLSRLENTSPNIANNTSELWKDMCFKCYPLAADRYHSGLLEEPESWRDQFFALRHEEAKRFEELGSRLRHQRIEAEERKKEKEVKLTDRMPPSKRPRGWQPHPPRKTLFQKTRTEASKIQKTIIPSVKLLPPPPPSSSSPCVIVKTVAYRRPPSTSSSVTSSEPSRSPTRSPPARRSHVIKDHTPPGTPPQPSPIHLAHQPNNSSAGKKDPMSTLFMPKHRAHSQRPIQPHGIQTR
ncbi:hypothetical protein PILCRDRAFT_552435 [Piloderma croceum F 1598]|uniref:Elongin-A n=1 Tax=Piloderma croceum (strain F 1598) TaxID=765440 RepID=A0A0C3F4S7_PILCF|nr:hypothetical protein PILCRDRAFT_552435 [Piloderma croceum F 1598]